MGGEENPRTSHGGEKGGEENLRTSHRVERGGEETLGTSQRATIPRTGWATIPRELAGDQPENWRVPMFYIGQANGPGLASAR